MKFAKTTIEKMDKARAEGFTVIVGNDWRLKRRPKYQSFEVRKIAQTNDRHHGRSVRTVWAIRPKTEVQGC
ncbi:MAG: hypothetical protein WC824_12965 [Bacteroidota bacterium]|jgi:hypothetical protein